MTIDNESLKELTRLSTMIEVISENIKDIKSEISASSNAFQILNTKVQQHDNYIAFLKDDTDKKLIEKNLEYKKVIVYSSVLSSSISIISIIIAITFHLL